MSALLPARHTAVGEPSCTRIHQVEVHPMEVTRHELLKGAAALGVVGALPQALPGAAQAQTTQKKELVTAQGGDISKFDPHYSTSSNDIRVSFNLFDNLTSRHPDGKLYAGLATEWKLEGQTTWRFKLRQGVKFHNGDPFTSADAKFSVERTYDPAVKTMVSTALSTIDRIEAPDPYSLVIHTKKPDPLLPARLAFYGGQIVPKKYVESVGSDTFTLSPSAPGPSASTTDRGCNSGFRDSLHRPNRRVDILSKPIDYRRRWGSEGGGRSSLSVSATFCRSSSMPKGFAINGQPASASPDTSYPDMSMTFIFGRSESIRRASSRPSINGMTTSTRSRSMSPGRCLAIRMASRGSEVRRTTYPAGSRMSRAIGPMSG